MGMTRRNPVVMGRRHGYQRTGHPGRDNIGPRTIVSMSPVPSSLIGTPPVSSVKKDRNPDIGYRVHIGSRYHNHGGWRVEDICRGAGVDSDIQIYNRAGRRCDGPAASTATTNIAMIDMRAFIFSSLSGYEPNASESI